MAKSTCRNCKHGLDEHADDGACMFSPGTYHPHIIYCRGCHTATLMMPYCIVQLGKGDDVEFTCNCGNKIELQPEYLTGRLEDRVIHGHAN